MVPKQEESEFLGLLSFILYWGGVGMSQELEQWLLEEWREGYKEGFKKGLKKGEDRVAALWERLEADGRLQDFYDAIDDETIRKKLYDEYGIEWSESPVQNARGLLPSGPNSLDKQVAHSEVPLADAWAE